MFTNKINRIDYTISELLAHAFRMGGAYEKQNTLAAQNGKRKLN